MLNTSLRIFYLKKKKFNLKKLRIRTVSYLCVKLVFTHFYL